MVTKKTETTKLEDQDWKDKLVKDVKRILKPSKVLIRERNLYEEELVGPDPFYEVVIIYPQFEDLEYHDRLNMVWPVFAEMPDKLFKKIIGLDCATPEEYHRRVA